jgi:hypothetical protein
METGNWLPSQRGALYPLAVSNSQRPSSSFYFPVSIFQFLFSSFYFPVSIFKFPVSNFDFPFSSFHFPVSIFELLRPSHHHGLAHHRFDLHQGIDGNLFAVVGPGNLLHHALPQRAPDLPQAGSRDGYADVGDAPCQIAYPDFAGGLLAEKETREKVNDGGKDQAARHSHRGAHLRAMTKVDTNGPEAAKGSYENTQDASAEDADPWAPVYVAVKISVVACQVAMLE